MEARLLVDSPLMEELDKQAQSQYRMPGLVLMERAALATFDMIQALGETGPWTILAGGGNNGGDALALARLLFQAGEDVRVFAVLAESGRRSEGNAHQATVLEALDIPLTYLQPNAAGQLDAALADALGKSRWLVDGLCGIGQSGALRGLIADLITGLAAYPQAQFKVLALDSPSGIYDGWTETQLCLPAAITACFGFAKRCLFTAAARARAGEIHVLDIGFPRNLAAPGSSGPWLLQGADLRKLLPDLQPDIHKYDRGRLAVAAGSLEYPGAALLCARSAAHSRAGLVNLVVDPPVRDLLAAAVGNLVIGSVWDKPADALVVGPGWGRAPGRLALLASLVGQAGDQGINVVLDADALHALGSQDFLPGKARAPDHRGWLLTPHSAELSRLMGCSLAELAAQPWHFVRAAARRWSATVVLKGGVTWIAQPDGRCHVLDSANPVLATAGTGDVFAGICGALLGVLHRQGVGTAQACEQAALAAVLVLESAGQRLATAKGWAGPQELIEMLPEVFAEFSAPVFRKTVYNDRGAGRRS